MSVIAIVLQVILALGFFMFGLMKFGAKQMVDEFTRYGYPQWFRVITGLLEVLASVSIFYGIWHEEWAVRGSLLMIVIMIGALLTHIKLKDSFKSLFMPLLLLALAVVVLLINGSHLV